MTGQYYSSESSASLDVSVGENDWQELWFLIYSKPEQFSTQKGPRNASKYAFRDEKVKNFLGRGKCPIPRPTPSEEGHTPLQT